MTGYAPVRGDRVRLHSGAAVGTVVEVGLGVLAGFAVVSWPDRDGAAPMRVADLTAVAT